jgi:hypothetical protein
VSKNNQPGLLNDKTSQVLANQQVNRSGAIYVRGNKTSNKAQTRKATEARRLKLFSEWRSRLQRMGLGEDVTGLRHDTVDYGHEYDHSTPQFNYHKIGNNTPYASIFGTSATAEDLTALQMVMIAESQPTRPNSTYKRFWPNAEADRPGYRLCMTGGAAPSIVAGNYHHNLLDGEL